MEGVHACGIGEDFIPRSILVVFIIYILNYHCDIFECFVVDFGLLPQNVPWCIMDFPKVFIFHKWCSFQCSYNTRKMFHGAFLDCSRSFYVMFRDVYLIVHTVAMRCFVVCLKLRCSHIIHAMFDNIFQLFLQYPWDVLFSPLSFGTNIMEYHFLDIILRNLEYCSLKLKYFSPKCNIILLNQNFIYIHSFICFTF